MPTLEIIDVVVQAPDQDGNAGVTILGPLTLTLTERRVGLIGANGSGKSTLARLLNGLVTPTSGVVRCGDLDTVRDGAAVRRAVGFVFTDPEAQLVMPTAAEDVALSLRRHPMDQAERRHRSLEVLAEHGLDQLADVSVHALSGGQKQLLAIAGVLATDPSVLVADEPTTLLDLRNTRRIADLLFGLEQQVVLVTHDLALARRCDRVVVVEDGRVGYDGTGVDAVAYYQQAVEAAS